MAFKKVARRTFKRRRTRRAKKTKRALVTKTYLNKVLNKHVEHKRTSSIDSFTKTSALAGLGYFRFNLGGNITPGTTDKGRIGSQIVLTGFSCSYVFQAATTIAAAPPYTMKMFLVQMKSTFAVPDDVWFKTFDAGAPNAYEPLSISSFQDGRRALNTDSFKVLGTKSVTLNPSSQSNAFRQSTGKFYVKLPKVEMKFLTNDSAGTQEIIPGIYLVMYVYTGSPTYSELDEFQIRMCNRTYYMDT